MHDIFQTKTKYQHTYGMSNKKSTKTEINWKLWLIISIGVALIAISFFITGLINKKTLAFYDTEITESQKKLQLNYQKRLEQQEKTANDLVKEGIYLLEKNQLTLAPIALEAAAKKDANFRDAWLYTGYSYLKEYIAEGKNNQNLINKAKDYLETAKNIDPLYPLTYKLLSTTYYELNDAAQAEICYNKAKDFDKQ